MPMKVSHHKKGPFRAKRDQAFRKAEKLQTLRERATLLPYTCIAYLV